MNKIKNRIIALSIICSMITGIVSYNNTVNASETYSMQSKIEVKETELSEIIEEEYGTYVVLADIEVTPELMNNNILKITLTNTGAFVVNKWAIAYEASYNIKSIENAELVYNNQVKKLQSISTNETLHAGHSIVINLEIEGTYDSNTEYRVYGFCDGVSEEFAVMDSIKYDATTGETSLSTYDIVDIPEDTSGNVATQGLDVITTDISSLRDIISPQTVFDNDTRTLVNNVDAAPYSRIGLIVSNFGGNHTVFGTGFLISSRHMLTAAHLLSNYNYGEATSVTVYFSLNGVPSETDPIIEAVSWECCASFDPNKLSSFNGPAYDWAHIELQSSPNRGYFTLSSVVYSHTDVTLCGYPFDKCTESTDSNAISGYNYYMYKDTGTPHSISGNVLYHKLDMYSGQSGGPIYNNSNQVVAINNKNMDYDSNFTTNRACKITSTMITAFRNAGWCS